ncbi:MAG: hypothetical protein LBT16_04900 [Treponema sp.]|jgi:hypothetical protein|nr:hypothetical protein [Treponema sp.]
MNIIEIQTELLRQEYPHLLPDEDPDIERYYFLRNSNRAIDAMNLYQNKLKPRYPDDQFRTALFKLYRSRNPLYKQFQGKAYRSLGVRCLEKMKRFINYIADRVDAYNPKDVYSTIKAAELIKQVLPNERYEAMAIMERLLRYSRALNLRTESMSRATELIRSYLSESLAVVDEERRRRENVHQRALVQQRQLVQMGMSGITIKNKSAQIGDLMSAIMFSKTDLARIEIPKSITRIEDQTLAYCAKYWNLVGDHAFGRILFLYSRKYHTKNYDIYQAILRGQQNKKRDDEILSSVMSCLVSGYYYSVLGDRYIQRQWLAIKAKLQQITPTSPATGSTPKPVPAAAPAKFAVPPPKPAPAAAPAKFAVPPPKPAAVNLPAAPAKPVIPGSAAAKPIPPPPPKPAAGAKPLTPPFAFPRPAAGPAAQPAAPQQPPKPAAAAKPTVPVAAKSAIAPKTAAAPPAVLPVPAAKSAVSPSKPIAPTVSPAAANPANTPQPAVPPPKQSPALVVKPVSAPVPAVTANPAVPARAVTEKSVPPLKTDPKARGNPLWRGGLTPGQQPGEKTQGFSKPQGSVSHRLQELSGRSYDVYQDRFLAHSRQAIRKVLGADRGLFFNVPAPAEDLLFNFLKDHYNDPYMNWETSEERKTLSAMGFELKSIMPIIDECYDML